MAKVTGFSQLKKKILSTSQKTFKVKVHKIVNSINDLKSILLKEQQRRLANTNLNDKVTTYPHKRTGNLMNNLINIKMQSFSSNNFKKTAKGISYTHTSTNTLDGGTEGNTVYKVYKGKRYNYAEILQNSNKLSKWNNYFQKLQSIFEYQYTQRVNRLLNRY